MLTNVVNDTHGTGASVEEGLEFFIDAFVQVREGDRVLVLYTPECREWAARLTMATTRRGIMATPVGMRPLVDTDFGERLEAALPRRSDEASRLVIVTLERDDVARA